MDHSIVTGMNEQMEKTVQALRSELQRMRTGRASPSLVQHLLVNYYGSDVPLSQVANVTVPDARTLQIAPWETQLIGAIERAIQGANIGLNPQSDGKLIRIPLPAMTEERRKELVKMMKKIGEESRVAIRNQRRDANELIKKSEKSKSCLKTKPKSGWNKFKRKQIPVSRRLITFWFKKKKRS
jgi:ribosome recycling factor